MAEDPVTPSNPEIRFEGSDVVPKALLRFMIFLVLATLAVAGLMRLLYFHLAAHEASLQPSPPIMAFQPDRQPPFPRLEERPADDLAAARAEDARIMVTYGWVDQQAGVVRIPIEKAMALLLERGLPVAPPVPATPSPKPGEVRK